MKTRHILTAIVLISFAVMASSCVTTTTRVTSPDGTITETIFRGPDAASVQAASGAIAVATQIIAEK